MSARLECWNGVRWCECDPEDLPYDFEQGRADGLVFHVKHGGWRAWPTHYAKRDWQRFMAQTFMADRSGDSQWNES